MTAGRRIFYTSEEKPTSTHSVSRSLDGGSLVLPTTVENGGEQASSFESVLVATGRRRRGRMYYRVAIQVDHLPLWQWKSTVLSSLDALFHWLRLYRAVPRDGLRIFSCSLREELNEQLLQENQGLGSSSVTAIQFLQERMICSPEVGWGASAPGTRRNERTASIAVVIGPSPNESSWGAQTMDERGGSLLEKSGARTWGGWRS
jgi:hypothetical protein